MQKPSSESIFSNSVSSKKCEIKMHNSRLLMDALDAKVTSENDTLHPGLKVLDALESMSEVNV